MVTGPGYRTCRIVTLHCILRTSTPQPFCCFVAILVDGVVSLVFVLYHHHSSLLPGQHALGTRKSLWAEQSDNEGNPVTSTGQAGSLYPVGDIPLVQTMMHL
jgi:hypothetical protein